MPTTTLPAIGTIIAGTDPTTGREIIGRVVGYDLGHTKIHLGRQYLPGKFSDGGTWLFANAATIELDERAAANAHRWSAAVHTGTSPGSTQANEATVAAMLSKLIGHGYTITHNSNPDEPLRKPAHHHTPLS